MVGQIDVGMAPSAADFSRLDTVPRVNQRTAEVPKYSLLVPLNPHGLEGLLQ